MLIIADKRIPEPALTKLSEFGQVFPFYTNGITYPTISCHPDIFMVQSENGLLVAPNFPDEVKQLFFKNAISFEEGNALVGSVYPQTAAYNAVITNNFFIHNLNFTDPKLLAKQDHLEKIQVRQAYTRCNLLALRENHFITSDHGIEKTLKQRGLTVLYVAPPEILLPGMKNGFFGGCCGICNETIFIIGSLDFYKEGKIVRKFIEDSGYKIVELYDGPLFDGGGLLMIEE